MGDVTPIKTRLMCGTVIDRPSSNGTAVKSVYRAALPDLDTMSRADLVLRLENMADTADLLRTLVEGVVRCNERLAEIAKSWEATARAQEKTFDVIGKCIDSANLATKPHDKQAFLKIARDHSVSDPWPEIPPIQLPDLARVIAGEV